MSESLTVSRTLLLPLQCGPSTRDLPCTMAPCVCLLPSLMCIKSDYCVHVHQSALGLSLVGPSWRGKADAAFSYEDESKSENEGADAIEADKAANKMAWEVRIADIAEILESKETELRRAKAGIRTAQFKQAQTHGGNQERRKAQEELARYTARSHGLQSEIEALRQETAELQVLVVKLKTPSPKVGSRVGYLRSRHICTTWAICC